MKRIYLFILFFVFRVFTFQNEDTVEFILIIKGVHSMDGQLRIGIYDNEDDWLEIGSEFVERHVPVSGEEMFVIYKNMPTGCYAISIFHDEDNNGKMNKNFIGYPTEGFGFSNNVKVRFSAPKFDECAFDLKSDTAITVVMDY